MNEVKVFRDIIHKYIRIDNEIIWNLVNTKEMQRLRRIKQLGGTSMVYQTAEHSRFVHSLGAYEIVRYIINNNQQISSYLNDYDKLVVMCAGLLHDLGHGPFSHCFEAIVKTNHEQYTIDIILGNTEVNSVLGDKLAKDVASVIDKTHPNKVLVQLITSQLDADRMDYLLRDSYMTGTTYGLFDLERIIRTMLVIDDEIVIKESGVPAVEDYILARYQMYWQVYYHPNVSSYENLLIAIFKRLRFLYNINYNFKYKDEILQAFMRGEDVGVKEYLELDDTSVEHAFKMYQREEDFILKDLCQRFLNRDLYQFKDLDKIDLEELTANLRLRGYDPDYYLHYSNQEKVPYQYGNSDSSIKVFIDNSCVDLKEVSSIVASIVDSGYRRVDKKVFFI